MTWIDYEYLVEIIEEQLSHEPPRYWHPGQPPPPWRPPALEREFENYRWAMTDFVEWHLNQLPDPEFEPDTDDQRVAEWFKNHGPEIERARQGDIEPLRRKLPHLARFLHLPPWPKSKRRTGGYPLPLSAERAADLVPQVRAIWQRTYGKTKRLLKPTAEEVVAGIFGITAGDVTMALGRAKAGRHKARHGTVSS